MAIRLPKIIATSVIRGSKQGESHGGVYTVDFDSQEVLQLIDWNTSGIDWQGRGADRGLRGICFKNQDIYIAASDALFRYDQNFANNDSFKNPYLKHCHEICRFGHTIFVSSTGFDSLLAFDTHKNQFVWGYHLIRQYDRWNGYTFDPRAQMGPLPVNDFHLNMICVNNRGIFFSGLHTHALLHLDKSLKISEFCSLPPGTHNAQPFQDGIIFHDTENNCLRYTPRSGKERIFPVKKYEESELKNINYDESGIARQGFGRGLCAISERLIVGGSSPSTVSLHDLKSEETLASVNLTMDIRNAIHGLELWPYET